MAEKQPKKGLSLIGEKLLGLILDPKVIGTILVSLGIGGGSGFALADAGGADTARRVDSLEARVTAVEQRQMDFITASLESDTSLRAVYERRAEDKEKAAADRKAVEKLINLGGTP